MQKNLMRSKGRAALIHLLLSLLLFLLIVATLYFWLYPGLHFSMSGGRQGLLIMFWIDVVLGPLLTFIVFHPQKPRREIMLDLSVVAAVQLAALGYGAYTVYQEHPAAVVWYDTGSAIAIPHRDSFLRPKIREALQGENLFYWQGKPLFFYRFSQGEESYWHPQEVDAARRQKANEAAFSRVKEEDLSALPAQDYVLFYFVSKYKSAFVVSDADLHYLNHFAEQDAVLE